MPKQEPKDLVTRLAEASVDARAVLREMQIATSDMRKLIKEAAEARRIMTQFVNDMADSFKDKAAEALHEAGPSISLGVEDSIRKYTDALAKSTTRIVDEVSVKIESSRANLDRQVTGVMEELERVMAASRLARELSEHAQDAAQRVEDRTQQVGEALQRLSDGLSKGGSFKITNKDGNMQVELVQEIEKEENDGEGTTDA